ncbi:unnamed protein product, partial [Pylaiella littoralis]
AAAATALQQHRGKEGDEGKRGAKSGSESSSDEPPASSSYSIMNNTFRVDSRYSGLKAIGKGSFGFVCSGLDEKQGKRVAIKKIHPMAQHVVDAKHVLREIRLMRYLGSHPNIVSLEDLFVSEHYDELYIVMELLDSDLHRIIQSPQALGDAHHRYFMFQLLKGVKFLHHNRIIHRDLKPGNVLVTKNCQLRITDFGLARLRPMGRGADPDDEVDHPMTEHVVTRWYRPPELMLCPDGLYSYAVDLWSVGCIFAELLGRHPLFPGKNFMDQLTLIFDLVGSPKPHEVAHIRNSQARRFLESKQDRVKVPYAKLFSDASEHAIDLLEGLLVFDPPGRLSVDEALDHPYFQPLRKNGTSPDPEVPPGFEFDFESEPLCRVQLKNMILEEVESFQRAQRKRDRRARAAAAVADSTAKGASSTAAGNKGGIGSSNSSTKTSSVSPSSDATAATESDHQNYHHDEDPAQSQLQEQQQWLRRSRRQAAAVAAAAATIAAADGGGSRMHCDDGGRGGERERAPISAVRSAQASNLPVSEAATVRAGLGSFRSASQHSHWGAGSSRSCIGPTTVPPPDTKYAPPNGGAVKGVAAHSAGGAEPMDDDWDSSARTLPPQQWDGGRSRVHPPPTPEYHGHKSGYVGGLGGQRNNSRAAGGGVEAEVGHDHRWRVCGVGVGRQPQQMQVQPQQLPREKGNTTNKWPHSTVTTGLGLDVESLKSPVCIRRSSGIHPPAAAAAASCAIAEGSRRVPKGEGHRQQRESSTRGGGNAFLLF